MSPSSARVHPSISLSWALLCLLIAALLVAGGASRADVLGQVVVRSVAWGVVAVAIPFAERPARGDVRTVAGLLAAAAVLVLVQLVPLPPAAWQALPGRTILSDAAAASGQVQPWRPWSIVPGATVNALGSLIVPAATLLLAAGLRERERRWLPGLMLGAVGASAALGLLQVSGAAIANPLINETAGITNGSFANRNHFALFLGLGCLLAPVWAFQGGRRPQWRAPVGFGLVLLFLLIILATGSRAGLGLGVLGLASGLLAVRGGIRRELGHYPRWALPAVIAAMVAIIAIFVLISVTAGRAVAISRVLAIDPGQDMRSRGLPAVLEMVRSYFPFGSGFGGFDPIFRIHEPLALLKPTYFNHAHNDFIEVVLDGGLPGLLLLLGAVLWWVWASIRAWRVAGSRGAMSRLGSAALLLILLASAFDYPARTPMIMAVAVLAALWLADATHPLPAHPLPAHPLPAHPLPGLDQHL